MGDFYTEQLVKQKTSMKSMLVKVAMILLTVVSFLALFVIPTVGFLIPIVMIIIDMAVFKRLDLEFEYLYINGDLDIDKIMSQQSRKRVLSVNVKEMEIMAPVGYAELRPYENLKKIDCSSGMEGHKSFGMVVPYKGQTVMVLFEPNDTIINGIRMLVPRKVLI